MRKNHMFARTILAVLLCLLLLTSLSACGEKEVADPVNDAIQAELETYFLNAPIDPNKLTVTLSVTAYDENGNSMGNKNVDFAVYTEKSNGNIMIELEDYMYYELDEYGSINYDTSVGDYYFKDWYLSTKDDTAMFYYPNESGHTDTYAGFYYDYTYSSTEFDDSAIVTALNELFYPTDLSAIKGSFVSSEENVWGTGFYQGNKTVRTIDMAPFADVFTLMFGGEAPLANDATLTIYSYNVDEQDLAYSPSYTFIVEGADDFLSYVTKAVFGEDYTDEYTQQGWTTTQTLTIEYKAAMDNSSYQDIVLPQ